MVLSFTASGAVHALALGLWIAAPVSSPAEDADRRRAGGVARYAGLRVVSVEASSGRAPARSAAPLPPLSPEPPAPPPARPPDRPVTNEDTSPLDRRPSDSPGTPEPGGGGSAADALRPRIGDVRLWGRPEPRAADAAPILLPNGGSLGALPRIDRTGIWWDAPPPMVNGSGTYRRLLMEYFQFRSQHLRGQIMDRIHEIRVRSDSVRRAQRRG